MRRHATEEPTSPRLSPLSGPRLHAVVMALGLVLLGALGLVACGDATHRRALGGPGDDRLYPESRRVPRASEDDLALRRPAPARIVAIGDLHGDRERTLRALRLAGAVDGQGDWSGGSLVVVQTGDQIDRGDDDRPLLDLLERLRRQARYDGGDLVATLGNHEIMNVSLDFRYVAKGSLTAFDELATEAPEPAASRLRRDMRGRAGAFRPGGPYARKLAEQPLLAWFGGTVFIHGGILPKHLKRGLAHLDRDTRAWLRGERPEVPRMVAHEDGPLWTRAYGADTGPRECAMLRGVLRALGARRMVVGHTPQSGGITSACDERVYRIDVGLSAHYGGPVQVLQIEGDEVTILEE